MATVVLKWSRPTTRASGRPLALADIAGYLVEASHDNGAFVKLPDSAAADVERQITSVGPGDWRFKVSCFDKNNRTADPALGSITIPDDTPPSMILNLTVSIVPVLAAVSG